MRRRHIGFIPILCVLISVTFALFTRTHKFLTVSGSSMETTLSNRDVCLVGDFIVPQRGDIYVVEEPDNNIRAIKRLVGVPGDTVELIDGITLVNGTQFMPEIGGSWENMTFVLGADEYLFLGDNRGESYDSRYWSRPIKRSEILYHVSFRLYPISKLCRLE